MQCIHTYVHLFDNYVLKYATVQLIWTCCMHNVWYLFLQLMIQRADSILKTKDGSLSRLVIR